MPRLRAAARDLLPARLLHAYRVTRHVALWPAEPEMVAAQEFLSKEKVAIDVGANFGLFTSVLARHSLKVFAFEPNPACALYLDKVMPANCAVHAEAVSDQCGFSALHVPVGNGVSMEALGTIAANNRFESESRTTDVRTQRVATTTLDACLARLGPGEPIGFVNIDAEGHEFAVLRGAEGLLAGHKPVLLAELEFRHGTPVEAVFAWLRARNYSPRAVKDGHSLISIDLAELKAAQDETRLKNKLAGRRNSGYINNVFFVPD